VGQFGAAGGDIDERGGGAVDGGFGVGVFLGEAKRNAEGQHEDGDE
jgi:hypothetical protein